MTSGAWKDPQIAKLYKAGEHVTGGAGKDLIKQAGLLDVKQDEPLVILDSGCGTGIVSAHLYDMLDEGARQRMRLTCGDFSPQMVDYVKERIEENGWKNAEAKIVDGVNTGLPDNTYTHVLTNFALNIMSDPVAALNEIHRILVPSGICGFTTWESLGWIPFVRGGLANIPSAPSLPDTETFLTTFQNGSPFQHTSYVSNLLSSHGFEAVTVNTVDATSIVSNPRDFVTMFDPVMKMLVAKFWSKEEAEEFGSKLAPAVLEYMTGLFGEGNEVKMEMVAIVATGRKKAE